MVLLAAASAGAAPKPWTTEWIDDIWQAHLLTRGEQVSGTGALEEAYFRDALRVNPRSVDAVEQLVNYYGATAEPVMALGAALYGQLLDPALAVWTDAVARARSALRDAPAAPQNDAEQRDYKAGLDAMLALVQTNQLMLAEIEVRRLLTRFPRDGRLIENLATFARISGQTAMQAMHWLVYTDFNPTNFPAANNLAVALEQLGLPGAAFDVLGRFIPGNEADAYLMGNAALLAEMAGRWDDARASVQRWRAARPDEPEPWIASARIELRQGRMDEARRYWAEAAARLPAERIDALLKEDPFREHATALREARP